MTAGHRAGPPRASLWRQVTATCTPASVAARYVALVRVRAGHADPAGFAACAREDAARLATGLGCVLALHTPDTRQRCRACTVDSQRVDWPCPTRLAAEDGLVRGWPVPHRTGPFDVPSPYEGFAVAMLAVHDISPPVGGRPARCQGCGRAADACPVWALAEGFLGITWTRPGELAAGPGGQVGCQAAVPAG